MGGVLNRQKFSKENITGLHWFPGLQEVNFERRILKLARIYLIRKPGGYAGASFVRNIIWEENEDHKQNSKEYQGGKTGAPAVILNSARGIGKAVKKITKVTAPGVCIDNSLGILMTIPE